VQGISGIRFNRRSLRRWRRRILADRQCRLGVRQSRVGFAILWSFLPKGADVVLEWVAVGLGVLAMAIMLAWHFGRVRSGVR